MRSPIALRCTRYVVFRIMDAKPPSGDPGVGASAGSEASGCLGMGSLGKDRGIVERPKNLLPGIAPEPVGPRPVRSVPAGRRASHQRFERWLTSRVDRLDGRMKRRRERLTVRWDRLNLEDSYEGPSVRIRRRWYLVVNRLERLDALLLIRWYRILFGALHRWKRLAPSFVALGHLFGRPLGGQRVRLAVPRERLAVPRVKRIGHGAHPGVLMAGGLSVAIAVTLLTLLLLDRDVPIPAAENPPITDRSLAPEPSIAPAGEDGTVPPGSPATAPGTYSNARYLFSYPPAWDVSRSGTATILSDPDGQVRIAFDTAPPGWLGQASSQVLEQFTDSYVEYQEVVNEVEVTPQGYRSMAVGGTATDASRATFRFIIITIEGPDANHAVVVRFPADIAQTDQDAMLEVVDSFRILPAA